MNGELDGTVAIVTGAGGGIGLRDQRGRRSGLARRADLARFKDRESLALMISIKRAIDPDNRMNPRALFE